MLLQKKSNIRYLISYIIIFALEASFYRCLNENKFISLIINIQGQKGPSMSNDISGADVCASTSPKFVSLYIPGIPETGSLSITKVN